MQKQWIKNEFVLLFSLLLLQQILLPLVLGIHFDAQPILQDYVQFLSFTDLKDHLFSSLFYLHSQPPLFNLFIGLGLKSFSNYSAFFSLFFLALGISFGLLLYLGLRKAHVSKLLSLIAVLIFTGSPGFLLYRNWLFYTLPVAVLIFAAYLCLKYFEDNLSFKKLFPFLMLLLGVLLIHSMYHVFLYVLFWGYICLADRKKVRSHLLAGAPGLLIILFLVLKNMTAANTLTMSTGLLGMQVAKTAKASISQEELTTLVHQDAVDPLMLKDLYLSIDQYKSSEDLELTKTGVSFLDDVHKNTEGHRNFNHLGYFDLNRKYFSSGLYIISHYPLKYLKYVAHQLTQQFFLPSGEHTPFHDRNMFSPAFQNYTSFYNVLYLKVGSISLSILLALVLFLRFVFQKRSLSDLFLIFMVLYTIGLTIFITTEELNRYRFYIDGFLYLILIQNLAFWISKKKNAINEK